MATEKRLVDAGDLWSDIMMLPHNGDMISSEEVEQAIKETPTVEAKEVVHGRWIVTDSIPTLEKTVSCSVCHSNTYYPKARWHDIYLSNYCPQCGAKMDGD